MIISRNFLSTRCALRSLCDLSLFTHVRVRGLFFFLWVILHVSGTVERVYLENSDTFTHGIILIITTCIYFFVWEIIILDLDASENVALEKFVSGEMNIVHIVECWLCW